MDSAAPAERTLEVKTAAAASVVPTLRTIAADLALRQDLDLDAVEDLRMAVDEACALVLDSAVDGQLTCVFIARPGRVEVTVSVLSSSSAPPGDDELGWQLLTALTSSTKRNVAPAKGGYLLSVELARDGEAVAR